MLTLGYSKTFVKKSNKSLNTIQMIHSIGELYRVLNVFNVHKAIQIKYFQAYGEFVFCFRHLAKDKLLQPKIPRKDFSNF